MTIAIIGLDLAKSVFQAHGVDDDTRGIRAVPDLDRKSVV